MSDYQPVMPGELLPPAPPKTSPVTGSSNTPDINCGKVFKGVVITGTVIIVIIWIIKRVEKNNSKDKDRFNKAA